MKVSVSKDFGNNRKHVLPLVPEPTTVNKKEDIASVNLLSNPADAGLTKVKLTFKMLEGGTKTPREIIELFHNVERAFAGLNCNTGTLLGKVS